MEKEIETKCGQCNRMTHQKVLFSKKQVEEDGYFETHLLYMMVQCGGCKTISFLIRASDPTPFSDEPEYEDHNYPVEPDQLNITYNFLREKDQENLPIKLYELYEEVKSTFRTESNIMAGIGLRMLVEAICLQQKIAGRNLQEKINKLHTQGMIATSELPIIDKLRLIGNQSTHQIKSFSTEKLSYALDIVNHILVSIYILPKINRKLKI
jgi:hypothetical protein